MTPRQAFDLVMPDTADRDERRVAGAPVLLMEGAHIIGSEMFDRCRRADQRPRIRHIGREDEA